jgi:hypothetical protein
MTAGQGIVHSERTGPEDRAAGHRLHGLQTWVALPKSHEQVEPSFSHHPKASLPEIEQPGVTMRLLAGTAFGRRAPTPTFSPMIYLAIDLAAGAGVDLQAEHQERGVYVIDGDVEVGSVPAPVGHLAVLAPELTARIEAKSASRLVVLGGAKMDGARLIWWNFVASSKELIDSGAGAGAKRAYPPVPASRNSPLALTYKPRRRGANGAIGCFPGVNSEAVAPEVARAAVFEINRPQPRSSIWMMPPSAVSRWRDQRCDLSSSPPVPGVHRYVDRHPDSIRKLAHFVRYRRDDILAHSARGGGPSSRPSMDPAERAAVRLPAMEIDDDLASIGPAHRAAADFEASVGLTRKRV